MEVSHWKASCGNVQHTILCALTDYLVFLFDMLDLRQITHSAEIRSNSADGKEERHA
jgi:hypothetical protein